ncbi:MAG: hypothetical protein J7604_01965 [Sporocytophaga sp.]|uniref:hypothetical protein n=1 Tax=Sporocytophaga sp. TaxID=2231183 RepID=UPI001B2F409C|nr:hypothetical protein [Sporocytophaga sp.]MBO9698941.1 hypothetical protein [Sporocytophaga sp.]
MNKFIALFLVLIVLLQSNMKLILVGYYELNKSYIAANLCENKFKPSLKCEGKCFLQKKIKAQEKQEKKYASFLKTIDEIVFIKSPFSSFTYSLSFFYIIKTEVIYIVKGYSSPLRLIFQPPQ